VVIRLCHYELLAEQLLRAGREPISRPARVVSLSKAVVVMFTDLRQRSHAGLDLYPEEFRLSATSGHSLMSSTFPCCSTSAARHRARGTSMSSPARVKTNEKNGKIHCGVNEVFHRGLNI
jgi:hypothetical protein